MIPGLLSLLLLIFVLAVVWYIVKIAVSAFAPEISPILLQILGLIFLLVIVLAALQMLGAVPHWPGLR